MFYNFIKLFLSMNENSLPEIHDVSLNTDKTNKMSIKKK